MHLSRLMLTQKIALLPCYCSKVNRLPDKVLEESLSV